MTDDEREQPKSGAPTPPDAERGGQAAGPSEKGQPGGQPRGHHAAPGRPPGDRPGGDRPRGRPAGGRPRVDRPYGRPTGRPQGGRPYGEKSYRSGPGRPPDARGGPDRQPHGNRPYDDRGRDQRPRGDRPADSRRAYDGQPRRDRRVEYAHGQRGPGPRPQRGPWERDRGPSRPRGDWDRGERFAAPRPPAGPSPAELLAEDEEVVAGRRPVEEAFAARREAKRLLVVPERRAALDQLVLHATTLRIPVVEVEGGTITAVSGFDGHQGIALVVAPRRWATLDEVLALARSRGEPPFLLALDHLEDPQNVGTLLRSAEACGVHGVIFPTRGAAPISPAAIKTSAGAVEHLLLVPLPDLASGLVDLHASGVRVIGADGDASMTVREADLRGPIVIVTGSEGRGLNAKVRRRVDLMARIPMRGKVASLNASVAGSVFLFEAAAQRDLPESERELEVEAGELAATGEGQVTGGESGPSTSDDVDSPDSPEPGDMVEPGPGQLDEARSETAPGVQGDSGDLLPEAPPAATEEPA